MERRTEQELVDQVRDDLLRFRAEATKDVVRLEHMFSANKRTRVRKGEGVFVTSKAAEAILNGIKEYIHSATGLKIGKQALGTRVEEEIWATLDLSDTRGTTPEARAEKAAKEILRRPQHRRK